MLSHLSPPESLSSPCGAGASASQVRCSTAPVPYTFRSKSRAGAHIRRGFRFSAGGFCLDSRRRSTPASGVLPLFRRGKGPAGQLLHLQLSANPALAGRLPAQALRPDALIPAASSWGTPLRSLHPVSSRLAELEKWHSHMGFSNLFGFHRMSSCAVWFEAKVVEKL